MAVSRSCPIGLPVYGCHGANVKRGPQVACTVTTLSYSNKDDLPTFDIVYRRLLYGCFKKLSYWATSLWLCHGANVKRGPQVACTVTTLSYSNKDDSPTFDIVDR